MTGAGSHQRDAILSSTSPLGTIAKSTAAIAKRRLAVRVRWRRQSAARIALPEWRVAGCRRRMVPNTAGVHLVRSPGTGTVGYSGVETCGSPWTCPVCAHYIAEGRRSDLDHATTVWNKLGGRVFLLSLTFRHTAFMKLDDILRRMCEAYSWMTGNGTYRKRMKAIGYRYAVRALEPTWGLANGWHPHIHALLFHDDQDGQIPELWKIISEFWPRALARVGLTCDLSVGVDLKATYGAVADYVAKWGKQPETRPWGTADELARGHTKKAARTPGQGVRYTPWDLLDVISVAPESWAIRLFDEYARAFKGRAQLYWSKGLKEAVGITKEVDDETLAATDATGTDILLTLTPAEWALICAYELRGDLIATALYSDTAALAEYVRVWLSRVGYPRGAPRLPQEGTSEAAKDPTFREALAAIL